MPAFTSGVAMTDIHIRTRLDSVTPHLPDLAPLVGREVEIVVRAVAAPADPPGVEPAAPDPDYWAGVRRLREAVRVEVGPLPPVTPGTGDWAAAEQAARELRESGFDFDIYRRNDEEQERFAEEAYREWLAREQQAGGETP